MFDLTGKCALITGASGGIGGAIASALHAQGATVGLSGTRREALDAKAAELGDRVHVLPCNLGDTESVDGLIKSAVEAMGSVDILVNNAGITRDNLAMRMKDEEWGDVINVNLTSSYKLARNSLRGMMKSRKPIMPPPKQAWLACPRRWPRKWLRAALLLIVWHRASLRRL